MVNDGRDGGFSIRKSDDTFTVVGPWVVTADVIDEPQNLDRQHDLNGERRQDANTSDMVYTCADVVQYASIGANLEASDVITTGTPKGVNELNDGDVVDSISLECPDNLEVAELDERHLLSHVEVRDTVAADAVIFSSGMESS